MLATKAPRPCLLLLPLLLTALGCPGGGGGGAPLQPTPGTVRGQVTDWEGQPLAQADISISGTTLAAGEDVSFDTRTQADGTYSFQVPEGSYRVSATYDFDFEGRQYRYRLHPTDNVAGESYPSRDGIVRDFELKLSGLRPGGERDPEEGYNSYGGEVDLTIVDVHSESFQTSHFATEFPQGFTAEVTFTPEGPLADGSTGQPLTSTMVAESQYDAQWERIDVPLGRWSVSGLVRKPDGTTRALQVIGTGATDGPPQASGTFTFAPESGISGGLKRVGVRFVYGEPYPPVE